MKILYLNADGFKDESMENLATFMNSEGPFDVACIQNVCEADSEIVGQQLQKLKIEPLGYSKLIKKLDPKVKFFADSTESGTSYYQKYESPLHKGNVILVSKDSPYILSKYTVMFEQYDKSDKMPNDFDYRTPITLQKIVLYKPDSINNKIIVYNTLGFEGNLREKVRNDLRPKIQSKLWYDELKRNDNSKWVFGGDLNQDDDSWTIRKLNRESNRVLINNVFSKEIKRNLPEGMGTSYIFMSSTIKIQSFKTLIDKSISRYPLSIIEIEH